MLSLFNSYIYLNIATFELGATLETTLCQHNYQQVIPITSLCILK